MADDKKLIEQAETLGIDHSELDNDALSAEIAKALGESGTTEKKSKPKKSPSKSAKKKEERIKIKIFPDGGANHPVQVILNGKMYMIPREQEVEVPEGVVNILNDSVEQHFDKKSKKFVSKQSYPFQVLS